MGEKRYRAERRRGVRIMEQFNGLPFAHNGHGRAGFDCMGLIHAYLTEMGTENLVDEFRGITLDNYTNFYLTDREAANQVLLDLFDVLGCPVDISASLAGDIMIVRGAVDSLFPAIYAGNGNIMSAFADRGVRVVPLEQRQIIKVRRP